MGASTTVAIVGRPNVGKSTLFNRLTESRDAIVAPISGVTRDRHYGKAEWKNQQFSLIDTGGYTSGSDDVFESEIRRQVQLALDEAEVVLFMVDVETGITDYDMAIAELLRKKDKKVLLVANKVDSYDRIPLSSEFYKLGLGEVYCISSTNGSQTGEMLDALVELLPYEEEKEDPELPRISIVGRPNVGKSSFVNALTGEQRNVVTDISGTTRDSIDTHYNAFGFEFILVDTAGIRKRSKIREDIEFYSIVRSMRSIEQSDVCIMMVDATQGFEKQDQSIFYNVVDNHKGVVILVNKWDLVEKDHKTVEAFTAAIKERIAPFTDVPIIFTSATQKLRIHKAVETALEVHQRRIQKIPTSALNEAFQDIFEQHPPPSTKGKFIKIKFVMQLPTYAPAFAFYANLPQYIKDPYRRFLENKMRSFFDFTGVPIRIFFRKK